MDPTAFAFAGANNEVDAGGAGMPATPAAVGIPSTAAPAAAPVPAAPDPEVEALRAQLNPPPASRLHQILQAVIPSIAAAISAKQGYGIGPFMQGWNEQEAARQKQADLDAQRRERVALSIKALQSEKIANARAAAVDARFQATEADKKRREDTAFLQNYFKDPTTKAAISELEKQHPDQLAGMAIKMPDGSNISLKQALDRSFVTNSDGLHVGLHENVVAKPGSEEEFVIRQRKIAKEANHGSDLSDDQLNRVDLAARQQWAASAKDPQMAEMLRQGKELQIALMRAQLEEQPTKEDIHTFANLLLEHKLSPSQLKLQSGFSKGGQYLAREAIKEATGKGFDAEQAEAEYNLVRSPGFQNTVRYMDSVSKSLPRLQQTANALGNTNVRFVNGIANMTKDQLNDPTLKAFQTDVLGVADEVAKILQGGTGSSTSDAKLAQAARIFKESDSPQAIAAAITEVQELLKFRRQSLTRGTYFEKQGNEPVTPAAGAGTTYKLVNGQWVKQ